MFGAETVVQAQRDAIIVSHSGYSLRLALTMLLFVSISVGGFLSGFFVWHTHAKADIKEMVSLEVERRLEILLP
jgi:hypothetical protein